MVKHSRDIVEELKKHQINKGIKVSLYFEKEVYLAFKKKCHPVSPSSVLNRIMKEDLEDWGKK